MHIHYNSVLHHLYNMAVGLVIFSRPEHSKPRPMLEAKKFGPWLTSMGITNDTLLVVMRWLSLLCSGVDGNGRRQRRQSGLSSNQRRLWLLRSRESLRHVVISVYTPSQTALLPPYLFPLNPWWPEWIILCCVLYMAVTVVADSDTEDTGWCRKQAVNGG